MTTQERLRSRRTTASPRSRFGSLPHRWLAKALVLDWTPWGLVRGGSGPHARSMAYSIAITDEGWNLVSHLFDPPGRRGARATTDRRQMVDAMLFLARTGCQWRYLPERFGPVGRCLAAMASMARQRRLGASDDLLAGHIRVKHSREALPSMVVIDAQTVRGGRAGPTFHQAGGRDGRTNGSKRTILIERLGLPIAARVDSARPADITAGRTLLRQVLPGMSPCLARARGWRVQGSRCRRPPSQRGVVPSEVARGSKSPEWATCSGGCSGTRQRSIAGEHP